jgi:MFS superfamily sulfate permease-like transporter
MSLKITQDVLADRVQGSNIQYQLITGAATGTVLFPQAFDSVPAVIAQPLQPSLGSQLNVIGIAGTTVTGFSYQQSLIVGPTGTVVPRSGAFAYHAFA